MMGRMTEMVLRNPPLFDELPKLEARAIRILREYEPEDGYDLAFSGGKDSVVIMALTIKSGVKFRSHYSFVPMDPPELRQFIKRQFPEVPWLRQKQSFLQHVKKKRMLPTRLIRWCCEYYKHSGHNNVRNILGIRAEESRKRADQWGETKNKKKCDAICPIFHWSSEDVWRYIALNNLAYCSLYDEGFKRLGCVLCPWVQGKKRIAEMRRWPGIVRLWKKGARVAFENKSAAVEKDFASAEEYFDWWLYGENIEKWEATGKPSYQELLNSLR